MPLSPFSSMSLKYEGGDAVLVLDQRKLPDVEEWVPARTPAAMIELIQCLAVRGAPLIGIAASASLALFACSSAGADEAAVRHQAALLRESRPTAVNLMVCMDRMMAGPATAERLVATFRELYDEDVAMCARMASLGASLVTPGEAILTHCNTGALATAGVGTALGVLSVAHSQHKNITVWVDETRPLLQGGRLTAWELGKLGVPHTIICDSMAASLMRAGKVQRVFVGADRIALNGDFANKIGTYSLAVLCRYHNIPFHVVAPVSTIDFSIATGADIPIEERNPDEVRGVAGHFGKVLWSPKSSPVFNPAFDTTPAELITSWVLDTGILSPQDVKNGKIKELNKKN
jgi:methylthioribose-1-phosphate isomerase